MNRKLLVLVASVITVLALIAMALLWAVQRQGAGNNAESGVQIQSLTNEAGVSPISSVDGNALWYFNSQNQLFRINADGTGLTEFPLPALTGQKITRTLWPPSGDNLDFISTVIKDSGTSAKVYYNSTLKTYINLPANIQSIDWLPDSKRVVYIWQSADQSSQQLVMANADSTGFVNISSVFYPDLVVKASPDNKTVLLYRSRLEGPVNKIYAINLDTKEIKTVIEEGKNIEAQWVSANQFIFTQSTASVYPALYLYDTMTQKASPIGINTSLEKVTFSKDGKTLYSAVPKADNTGDTFIKTDLTTMKHDDYFVPNQNLRAKNLVVLGGVVYFVNTADGKIYKIE